jgi:hypothetical protein
MTLAYVALAQLAVAAATTHSSHADRAPQARAALASGTIRIDGRLDEPVWLSAMAITTFRQTQPDEGAPATQRTEVRVLFDGDALYIGARMYDTLGAKGVHTAVVRRDQQLDLDNGKSSQFTSDKLTIILDPYHDHLTRVMFEINPSGVKGDAMGAGGNNLDDSWDPVWDAAARVDSLGWTAELRIPLSQLRFAVKAGEQTWGLQIIRTIDRLNERDEWAFAPKTETTGPATYGHLSGLSLASKPHQFEASPYVSVRQEGNAAHVGDPVNPVHRSQAAAGADVKYALSSSLTVDATVSPDFGQVELDPAVLNLSVFETFYPEKRPFFVSGAGAFDFGGFNCNFCSNAEYMGLFYSRRIGRTPQLGNYYSSIAYTADVPANTTILGAAKITGRTDGGLTVGLMDAVTNEENGRYVTARDSAPHTVAMEPRSNYLVARVKQDLNHGATVIGGMITSTYRDIQDPILADSLHQHAEAMGADIMHTWDNRRYSLVGSFAFSNVAGSRQSVLLTEESSAHYFQHPDSNATSLQGWGAYLRLGKDNGDWLWEAETNIRSPGFEVNDLAYMRRADYVFNVYTLARQWTTPKSWYRDIYLLIGGQNQYNFRGDLIDLRYEWFGRIDLPNYWRVRSWLIYRAETFDDRILRGGPVEKFGGWSDGYLEIDTDARKALVLSANTEGWMGPTDRGSQSQVAVLAKPLSNVSLSVGPTLFLGHYLQYDSAVAQRYILANLDQATLSIDTRVNVAFTPTLTFSVYAQPFFANGHYQGFQEFDRPRTLARSVFGRDVGSIAKTASGSYCIDPVGPSAQAASCPSADILLADPDFNTRSLRGNAVLRWEYRPGATIFLVWQQTRQDYTAFGNFAFARDRALLFRAPADNVFSIKVSYWLGR